MSTLTIEHYQFLCLILVISLAVVSFVYFAVTDDKEQQVAKLRKENEQLGALAANGAATIRATKSHLAQIERFSQTLVEENRELKRRVAAFEESESKKGRTLIDAVLGKEAN